MDCTTSGLPRGYSGRHPMTISHFITVHFITLAWWSFILAQVPISPNCVFDASLVRTRKSARHGPATGFEENTGHAPQGLAFKCALAPRRFRIAIPCYPNAPFSFVFTESMQRLQNVALALKPIALMTGSSKKLRKRRKKTVRT